MSTIRSLSKLTSPSLLSPLSSPAPATDIAANNLGINDDVDTSTYKNQQAIFVAFLALGGLLMPVIWRYGVQQNPLYQTYVLSDASLREGSKTAPFRGGSEAASSGGSVDKAAGVPVELESATESETAENPPWRIFDGSAEMMEALGLVWPR